MENQKLFSERQIAVSAILGGPLPAGFLFYLDYKRLGKEKEAYLTLGTTLLFTVILFFTIIKLPDAVLEKIPNPVFSAFYGLIIYFAYRQFLAKEISEKLTPENKASNWTVAGAIVVGTIISLIMIVGLALVQPAFPGEKMTFGKSNHEIYFDKAVTTEDEVELLGDILLADEYFGPGDPLAVYLDKSGAECRVTFSVMKEFWEEEEVKAYFLNLKSQLREAYRKDVTIIFEHYTLSGKTERKYI